jgi:DNA repair protein RecO (recombination protein O)
MQSGEWQKAYVLHRQPYRNTSYILDVFTNESGRISLVAKSARGLKSRFKGQLEPFTPLLISWRGRSELKNLTQAEVVGMPYDLIGNSLFCGFYLNELILRLFPVESSYSVVFDAYAEALDQLSKGDLQSPLRHFECTLLEELGYGLSFSHDTQGEFIQTECYYRFFPQKGFYLSEKSDDSFVFSGETLLALYGRRTIEKHLQQEAKRLLRVSLQLLLGNKPLKSREFFAHLK